MKTKIIHFLGIASLFLCILSMAIVITINFTPLYAFDIDYLALPEKLGLSKETLMANYRILMDYLNKPWIAELKLPNFPSSENGLFHFYEVKRLFMLDYAIALVTLIGSIVYLRFIKRTYSSWKLIHPFQWGMIVPFVVLFMIALNFDQLFIGFHKIFFNNDAWMFNPSTDPIILALPETFFMHCFVLAFILIELAIISGYFIAKRTAFKKN
ncbi:MAG: TIGR01906 family membrane protein [Carnobacterium sp.]|uniref:TIGR01906 family membrane protein n=1 Tax=Carnobacterium antarcticum TaxID=2126436 RepID=A0ABW4NNI4_9LACT|nr:TIGR01906 family membrane protein [Carnobacterium sp. CS13]ALV22843.1 C integral membrane protein [Carnobacterium sp. CP1]